MSTLVCFALKEESDAFRKLVGDRPGFSILITGIGQKNAAKTVRPFLTDGSVKRVFTCGFAGGLNPALAIGDVVYVTNHAMMRGKLEAAGAKPALIHCADRIAITVAEKQGLRQRTGADVVEMESEAIQALCRERNLPCATVRVISDTAGDDLPLDFNALSKPDRSLDFVKLGLAVFKSPWKIPALMQLQKNSSFAAKRLAVVLQEVV